MAAFPWNVPLIVRVHERIDWLFPRGSGEALLEGAPDALSPGVTADDLRSWAAFGRVRNDRQLKALLANPERIGLARLLFVVTSQLVSVLTAADDEKAERVRRLLGKRPTALRICRVAVKLREEQPLS